MYHSRYGIFVIYMAQYNKERFLERIGTYTKDYFPGTEAGRFAQSCGITAVMGPAWVGKNTVMNASGVPAVTAVTSRPERAGDTAYRRYLDFNVWTDRDDVIAMLHSRAYVQAASHPTTHELYACEPQDFPAQNCAMDITAEEYAKLRRQRLFGRMTGLYVVTNSYEAWQERQASREVITPDEHQKRMVEARDSLTMALGDPTMQFLINDDISTAADVLLSVSEGASLSVCDVEAGRRAAGLMLEGIVESGVLRTR
jgi:guanylate kinase